MKKSIIAVTLILTLALSACGGQSAPTEPATTASPTTIAPVTVPQTTVRTTTGQTDPNPHKDFFAERAVALTPTPEGFGELGVDFSDYSAFMIGETHGVANNYVIYLNYFKFLNRNYGVRFIFDECGYYASYVLNKYLNGGDKALLGEFMQLRHGTFSYSVETMNYFTALYEYNSTLPDDKKIVFLGVDNAGTPSYTTKMFHAFIGYKGEMPDEVSSALTLLTTTPTREALPVVWELLESNTEIFKAYFGDDYFCFYYLLRGTMQSYEFRDANGSRELIEHALREQQMCQNYADMFRDFGVDRAFGRFGDGHADLLGKQGIHPTLANYLNNENEQTKGKVMSILLVYSNSRQMERQTGRPVWNNFGPYLTTAMTDAFADAVDGDYGFCPSDGLSTALVNYVERFQYMLMIKNSPASKWLGQ